MKLYFYSALIIFSLYSKPSLSIDYAWWLVSMPTKIYSLFYNTASTLSSALYYCGTSYTHIEKTTKTKVKKYDNSRPAYSLDGQSNEAYEIISLQEAYGNLFDHEFAESEMENPDYHKKDITTISKAKDDKEFKQDMRRLIGNRDNKVYLNNEDITDKLRHESFQNELLRLHPTFKNIHQGILYAYVTPPQCVLQKTEADLQMAHDIDSKRIALKERRTITIKTDKNTVTSAVTSQLLLDDKILSSFKVTEKNNFDTMTHVKHHYEAL